MQDSSCLSFDIDSDAEEGDKCRYYNEASLTTVKQIDGTFWLGEPDLTTQAPSTVDGWESYSTLEVDGSRAIPMDGKITSFKWFGSNASAVTFYIYRHVTGNTYEMVAKAEAASTIVNQENTLNANIAVQTGDMIGWTWTGKAAFGFDYTNQGQTRYRAKENTGGPVNIGDQWLFDGGSDYRTYHYAASFTPNDSFTPAPTRNYCAAAKCQGHCGPVMDGGTGTFAWGVYEGFYTLNWRPGPTLPKGKNECPSGIDVVKCWNDEERGILWAYGVGGEDCHSTCSLAGAKPSDLMCDETVAITNGLTEVSEIMENFDNPYNSNDSEEFTCTKGSCWNGVSNKQILIHEYNSDCYVPDKTDRYVCDARVGHGTCVGQRFNQICPCVAGCSHAAGPSCVSIISTCLCISCHIIDFRDTYSLIDSFVLSCRHQAVILLQHPFLPPPKSLAASPRIHPVSNRVYLLLLLHHLFLPPPINPQATLLRYPVTSQVTYLLSLVLKTQPTNSSSE